MATSQGDNKREQIQQQHREICRDFQAYKVCPKGARCQRIHLYPETQIEQVVTMLDYIVGHMYDQAMKLSILDENVKSISESLKLDHRSQTERGRARGGSERKRYSRQMRARSASSERAHHQSREPMRDQRAYERPITPVAPLYAQQQQIHPHPQMGMVYNPPQHISPGQSVPYLPAYYQQLPLQYPSSSLVHDRSPNEPTS